MSSTAKPGKPDPPEITAISDKTASLKWKPPKDDGGAEIFNYVLEYKIEGMYVCISHPIFLWNIQMFMTNVSAE